MTFLPAPSAIAAAYVDPWRYAGTYGGYRPDPPPSRYVRFRRWLQERLWRKRKWRHASANVAFVRLEQIIAADRAAVPCGRWVKEKSNPYLVVVVCQLIAGAMRTPEPHRSQAIGQYRSWLKPRYRYEVRR